MRYIIPFLLLMCGCVSVVDVAVREHTSVAPRIQLGDSISTVTGILDAAQQALPQSARKLPDRYKEGDEEFFIYYARSSRQPDGITTDDEFTPYIFRNGILTAIGWATLGGPKTQAQAVSDTYIHIHESYHGRR